MFYGESKANSLPFVMIQILSDSSSASSRCYELIIIDLPTFILLMSSQTYLLDSTSRPEVGSSRIITFGFETKAIARDSFLFIPPERLQTNLNSNSLSITIAIVSFIVCSTSS